VHVVVLEFLEERTASSQGTTTATSLKDDFAWLLGRTDYVWRE
jgi:hypothetical protein